MDEFVAEILLINVCRHIFSILHFETKIVALKIIRKLAFFSHEYTYNMIIPTLKYLIEND